LDGEIGHFDWFAIESVVRDAFMSCGGVYLIICLSVISVILSVGTDGVRPVDCGPKAWANIWGKSDRLSAASFPKPLDLLT
jgi:hypothetical protein